MATQTPFSRRLRELREAAGLSQAALGERAGTSKQVIYQLEAGRRAPTLETACRLADALGLPLDTLRRPKKTS